MEKERAKNLDNFYLEFLQNHPEMIYEISSWEIEPVCANCEGSLKNHKHLLSKYYSKFYTADELTEEVGKRKCPHCGSCCDWKSEDGLFTSDKIDSKPIKTRKVFLESQKYKGWLFKTPLPRRFFLETKKVVDKSEKTDTKTS